MDRITLPAAEWQRSEGLARVVSALDGRARLVGGVVRDTLLGIETRDIDIATPLAPQDVIERLERAGVRAVPTGLAHGTVTAVADHRPYEVTTLRRDISTDGRHAVVAFTDDWREDAARRDFTMNALYADPDTLAVHDFFGGLEDLKAGRVRFIGDPLKRIAEDHLRILRFFRFMARFGDVPDAEGLAACTARARDLMALSRERIRDELLKLLIARDAVRVVRLMLDQGIFASVIPEIDADGVARLERVAARETRAGVAADPIRRLAALLPRDTKPNDVVGARLKLSNAERQRLASAIEDDLDTNARALGYRIGVVRAEDRLLLSAMDDSNLSAALNDLRGWTPPALPIGGGALIERGVPRGPDVARALRAVERQWIDEGFPDAARVAAIADAAAQPFRARSSE